MVKINPNKLIRSCDYTTLTAVHEWGRLGLREGMRCGEGFVWRNDGMDLMREGKDLVRVCV